NTAGDAGGGVATTSSAITINQSSVTGNSASGGGGIFIHNDNSNALTVTASTVSGNNANSNYGYYSGGGGVYARHVGATISNSTIANNTSSRYGGGVIGHVSAGTYPTTVSNSTVSGNSASYGGGISETSNATITLTNTVVGGNNATTNPDADTGYGGNIAAAFSLIGNTGTATITDNGGNLLNTAPQLGALANNGGPTITMLPLAGSPLIDAGDPAFSGLATDQRGTGFPRIVNAAVDIGAVEFGTAAAAAEKIPAPALGLGGQLGLGALLGLAGLAVARRRRNLGTAAGILLATTLALAVAPAAQAASGHESRHAEATTITSFTVQDKTVTIVLGDGQTLTTHKGQVHIVDKRSSATHRLVRNPSSVASGTPAAVRYETGKQGNTQIVRIRLTDTLQQAQALIANKP
ncbi:MAG TPA: choice-of-anchor Q domain-containing protein, partial [Rudaea sp.]|nr:choice-of-anchor Q domain-containing protein [Rudaea sp.]